MRLLIAILASIAGLYQVFALLAAMFHRFGGARSWRGGKTRGVSILKPIRGRDDGFYEAIRSHAVQQYPEFEMLFGVRELADPAVGDIKRLMLEFPTVAIRLIACSSEAPNAKVGTLLDLAREARYPILIVNDSDISVPAGYLTNVTAPLADEGIGLVTCLYRAQAHDSPSRFEALTIATEFAPSALVAPFVGVSEFGLGSTLAFRKADLDRIGGFAAIADYLADDYQLGRKLHSLGRKNVMSKVLVSTRLSAGSWSGAWRHQVRWARTVRMSRGGGYAGLPVTFTTLWAIVAMACGWWWLAAAAMAARFALAIGCGWFVLRSPDVLKYFYLIPLRDLWGVGIWVTGLFGNTVEWRGQHLRLDRQGKIVGRE